MKIELGCVNEHMARGMKIDGSFQFHHQTLTFLDRNPWESWSILWEMPVLYHETSQLRYSHVLFFAKMTENTIVFLLHHIMPFITDLCA